MFNKRERGELIAIAVYGLIIIAGGAIVVFRYLSGWRP